MVKLSIFQVKEVKANKYVYTTSAQKKLYEYLSSSLGEEFL